MKKQWLALAMLMVATLAACGQTPAAAPAETPSAAEAPAKTVDIITELGLNKEEKNATEYTVQVNSAIYSLLDFEDTSEYDNAVRGLIDAPQVLELTDGRVHIGPGTLYNLLDQFLKHKMIQETSVQGRRKNYKITECGKEILFAEYERLKRLANDYERRIFQ